jgi:hypothetical protein
MTTTHGARSVPQKRIDVKRIERRVAAQSGLKLRDMSGTQRRYLRVFAEAYRVVERLDAVDGDTANGNMSSFIAAVNASGRALERFEAAIGHQHAQRDQHATLDELAKYRSGGARGAG